MIRPADKAAGIAARPINAIGRSSMKRLIWNLLVKMGLYPHIYFSYSPFKIYEFDRLLEGLEWTGGERVLDIGCGQGNQTLLLAKRAGHVTGLDPNPDFVADARRFAGMMGGRVNADFRAVALENAGFDDAVFDLVFSICVIEHIPNHEEVLAESLRVLKPGGRMIFSVDSLEAIDDSALIEAHRQAHGVCRYFRADDLKELLERTGFTDVEVFPIFRSRLARELFEQGIRKGFNFGRLRTWSLTRRFMAEETDPQDPTPGLFLIARATRPAGDKGNG